MPLLYSVTDLVPWVSLGIALLVGILLGAERESVRTRFKVGLRDFVIVSALGWLASQAESLALTIGCLAALIVVLVSLRYRQVGEQSGITTELALVFTYILASRVGSASNVADMGLYVALTLFITLVLHAKRPIKQVFSQTLSEQEFADIIRFLAIIFIVLPLIPDGRYGPYGFFAPRVLWTSVILVASVSFVGYFLEKFLGARTGAWLLAVLGGMVSTTVMTQQYARMVAESKDTVRQAWTLASLSNSIQFPRVVLLLSVAQPELAVTMIVPLTCAFVAGLMVATLSGWRSLNVLHRPQAPGNPLRMKQALQFAVFMAGVALVGGAAYEAVGDGGLYITSAVGALLDVDAIVLTAADRVSTANLDVLSAQLLIVVAISANMVVKVVLAGISGTTSFMLRLLTTFVVMVTASVAGMLILS